MRHINLFSRKVIQGSSDFTLAVQKIQHGIRQLRSLNKRIKANA